MVGPIVAHQPINLVPATRAAVGLGMRWAGLLVLTVGCSGPAQPSTSPTPSPPHASARAVAETSSPLGPSHWQTPHAIDGAFEAMWVDADGTAGWAVGRGGAMFRMDAGTETWRQDAEASALTNEDLYAIELTEDGSRGWAIGAGHGALQLVDGRWESVELLPPTKAARRSITRDIWLSADGAQGWVVGTDGRAGMLLRLVDGQWTRVPGELGGWALWVRPDGKDGWLLSLDNELFRLRGGSWIADRAANEAAKNVSLYALSVNEDGTEGWAMGSYDFTSHQGVGLHLENGGWTRDADARSNPDATVASIVTSPDGTDGWASGVGGTIWRLDTGRWRLDPEASRISQATVVLLDLSDDVSRGWANAQGELLELVDGTWRRRDELGLTAGALIYDAWMSADGTQGWAVGQHSILQLRDERWHAVDVDGLGSQSLFGLWVSDDGAHGWAVGEVIMRLVDGRWRRYPGDFDLPPLQTVAASGDGTVGWAFGPGRVLRLENDRWHEDAETRELLRECWLGSTITDVWIDDAGSRGWAVGEHAVTFEFDGRAWARASDFSCEVNMSPDLHALAISGEGGWAVGEHGSIYRLRDGTWNIDPGASALTPDDLHELCLDAEGVNGWAVGDHGRVLRLEAGAWSESVAPETLTRASLRATATSTDGTRAWALGATRLRYGPSSARASSRSR